MNTDILALCFIIFLVTLWNLVIRRYNRVCPHCYSGFYLNAETGLREFCPHCKGTGRK